MQRRNELKGDSMKYLAHIEGEREQTIKEHSIGTAELAAMFAKAYRYVASFAEAWIETVSRYSLQQAPPSRLLRGGVGQKKNLQNHCNSPLFLIYS